MPIREELIGKINVVDVNFGTTAAFINFDEESKTFSIDGDLLSTSFVGNHLIMITMENESRTQVTETQGLFVIDSIVEQYEEDKEDQY